MALTAELSAHHTEQMGENMAAQMTAEKAPHELRSMLDIFVIHFGWAPLRGRPNHVRLMSSRAASERRSTAHESRRTQE